MVNTNAIRAKYSAWLWHGTPEQRQIARDWFELKRLKRLIRDWSKIDDGFKRFVSEDAKRERNEKRRLEYRISPELRKRRIDEVRLYQWERKKRLGTAPPLPDNLRPLLIEKQKRKNKKNNDRTIRERDSGAER